MKLLDSAAMGILFCSIILTGGCNRPADQLHEMRQSLQSALSTVQTAASMCSSGQVPQTYLRQTIVAADETAAQQQKQIAKISLAENDKQRISQQLAALRQGLSKNLQATDHSDISHANKIADSLGTASFMSEGSQ